MSDPHIVIAQTNPRVRTTEPSLVPYITQRQGEEAAPANLVLRPVKGGGYRLHYRDEEPADRDVRGVLWARCSFNPLDESGMPLGAPQWRMMHPARQRATMQTLRCQVCNHPARTPLGYVFLAGPKDVDPDGPLVLTNQPPVCPRHVRAAARLCPHLRDDPRVFLTLSAPLYGVHGTVYGYGEDGVQVMARPDAPLPYGHPNLPTMLASQLVRRLGSFRAVDLEELMDELRHTTVSRAS
ncbi:hypothetical protein ACFOOM_21960 [Streptomyces echinoruber]|uniref:Uncharacterized protein n=1 Tax=Streptomyces echinoruber TaxID=68898 RepID=A0A918R3H1_9ACTN|nr:hypothetical protein [Streptomyces echinoruber]GGZ81667.1 hypothetical protein GCM10010389_19330 [Streptomyces echinoruber]